MATVVFIAALVLYVATMCRTVFWWDTGELAANARVLGIPHRPGFPLYVLLGRVFGLAPFGDYFYRINFVSALTAAAALGVLSYMLHGFLGALWRLKHPWTLPIAIGTAMAAIAGTYTMWMQAVRAEVYAPTMLAVMLLLVCAGGAEQTSRRGGNITRWLLAAAFLAGLGMGLHNATFASVLPAFLILFIAIARRSSVRWHTWALAMLMFGAGLSVYLYLPVRASAHPALNWGWTATDRAPSWSGIVGADALDDVIATKMFMLWHNLGAGTRLIFEEIQWGITVLAGIGAVALWRKSRRWCLLVALSVVGNVAVTALLVSDFSDTNADIHGYLLPAMAMVGILAAAGTVALAVGFERLPRRVPTPWLRRTIAFASLGTLGMLGIAPIVINAPYCNLVGHHLAYDYGTEATANLDAGAIVFVSGANVDFVLRGLQYCDDWRPDVRVINRDLLPSAWYRSWMFEKFPDLEAIPIPADSQRLYIGRWACQLTRAGVPVFWEFTETSMDMLYHLVPAGHFFAVSADSVPVIDARMVQRQEDFERQSRFYNSPQRIRYDFDAQRLYIASLYRAGIFYESRGHFERARELFQRALTIHSNTGERKNPGRSSGQGLSLRDFPALADSVMNKAAHLDGASPSP